MGAWSTASKGCVRSHPTGSKQLQEENWWWWFALWVKMSSSWDCWEGVRKIIWRSKFLLCAWECQKLSYPVCWLLQAAISENLQHRRNLPGLCGEGLALPLSPADPTGGLLPAGRGAGTPGPATGPLKPRCSTGVRVLLRGGFCLLRLAWLLEIRVRLNANASAEAKAESQQTKLFGDALLRRERPLLCSDPKQHLLCSNAAVK